MLSDFSFCLTLIQLLYENCYLVKMNVTLLEKVEELIPYSIQQDNKVKALEAKEAEVVNLNKLIRFLLNKQ
ncbi:hypothetical protein GCM10027592_02800 [Spirosoma flavus]